MVGTNVTPGDSWLPFDQSKEYDSALSRMFVTQSLREVAVCITATFLKFGFPGYSARAVAARNAAAIATIHERDLRILFFIT